MMMQSRMPGLVLATVEDLEDPEKLGRVKLKFPNRSDQAISDWAPIARPLASGGFGVWFQPLKGDLVLVAFAEGQFDQPCVLGAIFSGDNQPPVTELQQRVLQTESGHKIVFEDKSGSESILIEDAKGNLLRMEEKGITLESPGDITIKGVNVTVEASGQLTGKGAPIHLNP
jgi:phage baseplate assembly protein V